MQLIDIDTGTLWNIDLKPSEEITKPAIIERVFHEDRGSSITVWKMKLEVTEYRSKQQ